jgi:hypothetical protein
MIFALFFFLNRLLFDVSVSMEIINLISLSIACHNIEVMVARNLLFLDRLHD